MAAPKITDFTIVPDKKQNHYKITYTSPKTSKKWSRVTCSKEIIENIIIKEKPKQKHVDDLKRYCKRIKKLSFDMKGFNPFSDLYD